MEINVAVVNGSLGTIGMALVRRLLDKGVKKVYAIAFPGDKRIEKLPAESMVISCDMNEIDQIKKKICEKVDVFFHLAWAGTIGPNRDDMLLQTKNIQSAVNAVYTSKDLGCEVFIGVGSQAEYGRMEGKITAQAPCFPTSGYGMAKLCAGQMTRALCSKLGMRHCWARVLSVYGLQESPLSVTSIIMDNLTKGEVPLLTKGEQLWDYLYADDAADALIAMAKYGHNGKIYPLGSGSVRPLHEYFEIIRDCINPSLKLGIGAIPYPPNQIMHMEADISELSKDTGFRPCIPFEEGAKRMVEAVMGRVER